MASDLLRLGDDSESYCRIMDPATGPIHVPIIEMNAQGAILDTRMPLQVNDYIDLTLALKGVSPRPLFAHVVAVDKDGVSLHWLHFDPSDEAKLGALLSSFKRGEIKPEDARAPTPTATAPAPAPSQPRKATDVQVLKEGTRRIVRPSTVFTPFSDGLGDIDDKPAQSKAPAEGPIERIGTRRIVRPATSDSGRTAAQEARKESSDSVVDLNKIRRPNISVVAEESGGQVVIAPTARFDRMPRRPDDAAGEGSSGSRPASGEGSGANRIPNEGQSPGDASGSSRISIIGQDGKLDIGASIRSKSKTVRASELAARHDRVRVLNMGTIKGLIQEAVGEAVQHLTASVGETERKRLLEEAEAGFQERLKAFQAEKIGAEAQTKHLQEQLRMAQDLLEQERKRSISADQFTVSESGLGEIEDKMRRVLERALKDGNVSPELQEQLRSMIAHILDSERERIRTQELEAQNAKIELLEKKISRLAGTLEETERQRDEAQELASALEQQGGGLRNVFTPGIKDSDSAKKRKLALMKEILEINRKMREEVGIPLSQDAGPAPGTASIAKAEPAPVAKGGAAAPPAAEAKPAAAAPPPASASSGRKATAGKTKDKAAVPPPPPPAPAPAPVAEAAEDDTAAAGDAPGVDPDDMPWEVQAINVNTEDAPAGVKRINIPVKAPPPLERKSSPGS